MQAGQSRQRGAPAELVCSFQDGCTAQTGSAAPASTRIGQVSQSPTPGGGGRHNNAAPPQLQREVSHIDHTNTHTLISPQHTLGLPVACFCPRRRRESFVFTAADSAANIQRARKRKISKAVGHTKFEWPLRATWHCRVWPLPESPDRSARDRTHSSQDSHSHSTRVFSGVLPAIRPGAERWHHSSQL